MSLIRSLRDAEIPNNTPIDVNQGFWNQFGRGAHATSLAMGGQLHSLAGGIAEAFGNKEFAGDRYERSAQLRQHAARVGPRVTSFDQLRQEGGGAADYVGGILGGTAVSALPALVTGAVTRNPKAALGIGTATYAPFEAGETIDRMRQQTGNAPIQGIDAVRAGLTGVGSAALQTAVPAVIGAKIGGQPLGNVLGTPNRVTALQAVGRNIPTAAVTESAAEATGTVVKQIGAGQDRDWNEVKESAIAGTIGGGGLGTLGAGADYLRGNASNIQDAVIRGADRARGFGRKDETPDDPKGPQGGPDSGPGGVFSRGWDAFRDATSGALQGVSESDLGKTLKERADNARSRIDAILADPNTPDDIREQAREWVKNVGNKTVQTAVAAADKIRQFQDRVREDGLRKAATDELRSVADKIANSEFLGDAQRMAQAAPEQAAEMLRESGQRAADYARRMGEDLLNRAGVSEETRQQVRDAMATADQAASQAFIAAKWKATDAWEATKSKAQELKDTFENSRRARKNRDVDAEGRVLDEIPENRRMRSEDYEGVERLIADTLKPYMAKINADFASDTEGVNTLASALRMYLEDITDAGGSEVVDRSLARLAVTQMLGDDAAPLLADLAATLGLGKNREMANRYFAEVNAVERLASSTASLVRNMQDSLAPGVQADRQQLSELASEAMAWARGERSKGLTPEQVRYQTRQIEREMERYFGDKARGLMRRIEKEAKKAMGRAVSEFDQGGNIEVKEAEVESSFIGGSRDKRGLMRSPEFERQQNEQRAREGKEVFPSKTEQTLQELKGRHPNARVEFVSVADDESIMMRDPRIKAALTRKEKALLKEAPGEEGAKYRQQEMEAYRKELRDEAIREGRGMIRISYPQGDRITRDEIDAMRFDTDKYNANESPSAIRIGEGEGEGGKAKHVFDATRVTRVMEARINREGGWTESDGKTRMSRIARAFSDGVASLMQEYGRFEVPGDLVISRINGRDITVRQAMAERTKDAANESDAAKDADLKRMADIEAEIDGLIAEFGDSAYGGSILAEIRALDAELAKLQFKRDGQIANDPRMEAVLEDGDAVSEGQQEVDPDGNIHQAAKGLDASELQARFNLDGSFKQTPSAKPPNAKPVIALAERIRDSKAVGREKIADRLTVLARNMAMMGKEDQRTLLELSRKPSISEMIEVINGLARKYADRIVPPKGTPDATPKFSADGGRSDNTFTALDNPRYKESSDQAEMFPLQANQNNPSVERRRTPDPKAVAAKKAAFLEKAASGDKALIAELKKSDDIKGLQRAMDALLEADVAPEVQTVIHDRLAELVKEPGGAYATQTRKYSRERIDPDTTSRMTKEEEQAVLDYLHKVLGDRVQVEFADILHAGDFTRQEMADVIRVSVHALNPLSTAYHESLHAFFALLKDKGLPEVQNALLEASGAPHVVKQLRERLKHSPEALKQLADPEERAAYAFQFYLSDPSFSLKPETKGIFAKIAQALRNILGVWSNAERAEKIMDYFAQGDFKAALDKGNPHQVYKDLIEAGRNQALVKAAAMTQPMAHLADALVGAGSARLRDSGIPALRQLADLIKQDMGSTGASGGYIPASRLARTNFLNDLVGRFKNNTEEQFADALEALQTGKEAPTPEARLIVREVKQFLRKMRDDYMTKAGVEMGDLGPDYFPRVWDAHYISLHQDDFRAMLAKYGIGEGVIHKIVAMDGDEMTVEVNRPGNQHVKERKLAVISAEDAAPFLKKDFWGTLDSYVTQATRRAEWARRFGDDNSGYDALIKRAIDEGATQRQVRMAEDYVRGVNGTLGDGLDPSARRLMGNIIVYQNIRLLPAAIFSSIVDPMGVMVRGGTIGDAWQTFKRGIKELPKSWQKDPQFDAQTELAETLGVIDNVMMSHFMSQQYTQGMVGGTAKKINDAFFKYNFMEGFNRSMRVGATQAAIRFIQRHVTTPNEHSARYLSELGLRPDHIVIKDGKLAVTREDGLTASQAHAIRVAINRWVDGAVLRPDPADRPIWMNDPHWALISHLKSFIFAFHHTILKRVKHEMDHGNYKPAMALSMYVPVMLASDMVKDALLTGFDEPDWKRNWTASDHLLYAVERAGVLGVGQFAFDGLTGGVGQLTGPTLSQLGQAVEVFGGNREFSNFALRSMPANSLYREHFNNSTE